MQSRRHNDMDFVTADTLFPYKQPEYFNNCSVSLNFKVSVLQKTFHIPYPPQFSWWQIFTVSRIKRVFSPQLIYYNELAANRLRSRVR